MTSSVFLLTYLTIGGCASQYPPANPADPFEAYNRTVYKFNRGVDKAVYKPIAQGYAFITPGFVRRGVTNFFSNIYQVPTMANDVLQANLPWFVKDTLRLTINTTLGIGGLFDVAKPMGLEQHPQDFGLTLAVWGFRQPAYFLVPFLPTPSTLRDIWSLPVDYILFYPPSYVSPAWIGWAAWGLNFIDKRAAALPTDQLVNEAFDPYIFVRDAYLQHREALVQKVRNRDRSSVNNTPDLLPANAKVEVEMETTAPSSTTARQGKAPGTL